MKNCCGPFKRGKPAKAINPNQQCFVDCCGDLCPPDGCCDSVKVMFECGCACECPPQSYNFGGLKFQRKKRKKKFGLPSFSQKTLAANGFTFAVGGTIPSSSSSSSSEGWLCVEPICVECPWHWNGSTCVDSLPHPLGVQRYHFEDECLCDQWDGSTPEGDPFLACCRTNPGVHPNCPGFAIGDAFTGLDAKDCGRICIVESEYDATKHVKAGGPYKTKEECEANCCGETPPASSSSSSSSSCECKTMEVILTTDACCLYVSGESIEVVGSGTVTAAYANPSLPNCIVTVRLNGSADPITVEDGDAITVEVSVEGDCTCCEVSQDCQSSSTASLWVQKSKEDRKTISLSKKDLLDKVRFATNKVRGRRPKNP